MCGDGRNDSPGHSAKYCMCALMEQFLEIIVDVEVVDKRETGGVSTNMKQIVKFYTQFVCHGCIFLAIVTSSINIYTC